MYFCSTRNENEKVSAPQAVLRGLASDGGLYVDPELAARSFDWQGALELDTFYMAEAILKHLLPEFDGMAELVKRAYEGKFKSDKLTPLKQVGDDFVLELFHGPTSAFKDVALSMLPQLMTAARKQEGIEDKIVILTATSGDTGKAALEGFHDVDGTGIIVFYPDGGVSPIQKAQMVTQEGKNVKVCALRGNFDDCQRGVKLTFSEINRDGSLEGKGVRLSSANSINIGRLAPQVVYYFLAYAQLIKLGRIKKGDEVSFVVPTGNFGDILAGYYAKLMGLPVKKLVCASNANNVLTDFIDSGVYDRRREFKKTISPSMDILVSSNLERLLYYASGRDCSFVATCMAKLSHEGVYKVREDVSDFVKSQFAAYCCDEENTKRTIGKVFKQLGYLCDPHTAVAFYAAERYKADSGETAPVVVLSTASPFKFPQAVLQAVDASDEGDAFEQMARLSALSGRAVPENLASLEGKKARFASVIEPDALKSFVLSELEEGGV